jgi:hypothetical protein
MPQQPLGAIGFDQDLSASRIPGVKRFGCRYMKLLDNRNPPRPSKSSAALSWNPRPEVAVHRFGG